MVVQLQRRLFTADEYEQMIRTGVLKEDERVELLEGDIVVMNPIGSRHAACVKRLNQPFATHLGERAIISIQDPVRLDVYSEPQPDLALLKPRPDFYADALPTPDDILLLVEVAETSASYDRIHKLPLYARTGVRETWLIDLAEERIEVYRQPTSEGYRETALVHRGERFDFQAMSMEIEADSILPERRS